jgi:uncharacterized protein (TIGR03083 family)
MDVQASIPETSHNGRVEIAEHIAALRRHGESLADAADLAGLTAPVPTCPQWRVQDLLRHVGYIHRWAARHIIERPEKVIRGPVEADILKGIGYAGGDDGGDLLAWFRDGHAALVETLSQADPALVTATFIAAPSPLAFWARRQAHETAIHRVDAELAARIDPGFPADFAADGVDEVLLGFGRRRKYQPRSEALGTFRILATDTGDDWYIEAVDGLIQARRGPDDTDADGTMSGPASGLYLHLWNRRDPAQADVMITGDITLLTSWQSSVRVRWS